jgi:hypothetical protein
MLTAVSPGSANVVARAGAAQTAFAVQVLSTAGVSVEVTPQNTRARQGDVVRFSITVKDSRGAIINGLTPTWSIAPGQGVIDDEGAFVGNTPGRYMVTAGFGAATPAPW